MARRKSSERSKVDWNTGMGDGGGTVCQRCGINILLQVLLTRMQTARSLRERYEASRSASSGISTIDIGGGSEEKAKSCKRGKGKNVAPNVK